MKSKSFQIISGLLFSIAANAAPGDIDSAVGRLEHVVRAEFDLQQAALRGLEDLLLDGNVEGLLRLEDSDTDVHRLLDLLSGTAEDAGMPFAGTELDQQVHALQSAIEGDLPGGLSQMTSGMRSVGYGFISLASDDGKGAAQPIIIRALFSSAGQILVHHADLYDAVGDLDGIAFSKASLRTADLLSLVRSALPSESLLDSTDVTRKKLESTHLPLVRALMRALRQTPLSGHFRDVMTAVLRGDLDQFGGAERLARVLNGPSASSLPGEAPVTSLRSGASSLGDLIGPLGGQEVRGLLAIGHTLQDDAAPDFAEVMSKIPELRNASAMEAGVLVEGLLTPGMAPGLPIGGAVSSQDAIPITRIAQSGLLGGGDDADGLLSIIPILGPILETLVDTLRPLIEDLLDLLAGDDEEDDAGDTDDGGLLGGLLGGL
jgi:hypothetical protein